MKNEKGENIPLLEIIEVVIVYCNAHNNYYIQNSLVLYIFISNKSFDQLLDISPKNFAFLKTFNSEFPCIEVWFTDQNSKPLEKKNKIDTSSLATRRYSIQPGDWKFVKVYRFLSFGKNVSKTIGKNIGKNISSKYIQKVLDHAKLLPASRRTKVAKDALTAASKRAIKKTETSGDIIGNTIDDEITSYKVSRSSQQNSWQLQMKQKILDLIVKYLRKDTISPEWKIKKKKLSGNTPNEPFKFRAKNLFEINDGLGGTCNTNS